MEARITAQSQSFKLRERLHEAQVSHGQEVRADLPNVRVAVLAATGEAQFQNRAGDFFGLFVANLFDQQTQMLGEYFEEDWSKIEPVSVEPGHQAEWVWLLRGFERITGCPTGKHREPLLASALRYRDEATGCLFDEGDAAGNWLRTLTIANPGQEQYRSSAAPDLHANP